MTEQFLPLEGIAVAELSQRLSGSYCGYLLAMLGASVTRVILPRRLYARSVEGEMAAALDRRKLLLAPENPVVPAAVAGADLVIVDPPVDPNETSSGTAVDGWLAQRGTGALITRITDFGRDGHYRDWGANSLIASAWTSASWAVGAPGRPPLTVPMDLPEYLVGTHAAGASVVGLLNREATQASRAFR